MNSGKNGKFTPSYGFGVVDKDGSTRAPGGAGYASVAQRTTEQRPVETRNDHSTHSGSMNTPTYEEIDAKLAAVEARMDTRLEKFQRTMETAVSDFRLYIAPLKGMKANIWSGTGIIVASIFAAFTLSFGAFDSGRETSRQVSDARLQLQQNSAEFRALMGEVKNQAAATAASFDAQLAKTLRQINELLELSQTTEKNQKTRAMPGDGQAPESVRTRP